MKMIYFFDNYKKLSALNAQDYLPDKRLKKYERFKQIRDKENCLGAYLLLCHALKNDGIDSFQLDYTENGKPFIRNSDTFINISHCKSGIVIATSKNPVGIDIQEISACNDKIMNRVFSPVETEIAKSSENKDQAFTTIWTLKESALKCDGKKLVNLQDYIFENPQNKFKQGEMNFATFEVKNLIISVCGKEDFSLINNIITVEDLP